jgi:hypothetical protein
MSMRYKGSRLSATANTPTSLTASGAWTLQQQMQANGTSTWPFVRDPQFNYVTMLLHGDGSAGANNGSGGGVTPTVTNFNADASTNNFNVTINGDARSNNFTPYQAGYYSNYFDGTSGQYLNAPANTVFNFGTGDFTVEAWVYPTSTSGTRPIIEVRTTGGANGFALLSQSGATTLNVFTNSAFVGASTNSLTLNAWNHVALTRSTNTWTYWINGVSGGSFTNSSTQSDGGTTGPKIGGSTTSGEIWIGFISNARITKGGALYTTTFTPSTTPSTTTVSSGTVSLLTSQSNRFIDNSVNAFTITVNGSPQVSPAQPFTLPSSVATYGSGYFDGTGDYLGVTGATTALAFGSGDFTIEFWGYILQTTPEQMFIDWRPAGTQTTQPLIYVTSAGVLAYYVNAANRITGATLVTGQWYHIAVSRSGTSTKMFLNGTQTGSTYTDTTVYTNTSTRPLIGLDGNTGNSGYLKGNVTDVRTLTGTALYTTTFTPPTAPLTAITNTSLLTTQYNGGGNNSGFKDSSQNNFVITRNGNTTQGTFAPYGSNWSNAFTASSGSYLSVPYSSAFNLNGDFTVECWINPSQLPTATSTGSPLYPRIFSFGTYNAANSIGLELNSNDPGRVNAFSIWYNGTQSYSANSLVAVGNWYHCAMVRSGTTITLYLNGTSILTITGASAAVNTSQAFYIASLHAFESTADACFKGNISNLRIVKGTAVYTAAFTPPTTPLTAISGTSLLTCADNRFVDDSTNNFTVTANGTPSVQRFSPFANATAYNPATTGGSAYLDGTTDYLSVANNGMLGSGNWTVELWMNAPVGQTDKPILETRNPASGTGSTGGFTLTMISSTNIRIFSGGDIINAAANYINQWIHIAIVKNGSTTTMYFNGVSAGTTTALGNMSDTTFIVGAGYYGSTSLNQYGNFYASDIRVVKGTAVYTSAFTPPPAPLTPTPSTQLLMSNTNSAILDQSMMNDLETVGNAQISTSVVKYGTASMKFDGDTDYVGFPKNETVNLGAGDFTIEFWAYWNAFGSDKKYVISVTNSTNYWQFLHDSTTGVAFIVNSGQIFSQGSNSGWSTGTWYHVALVRNGSTMTAYRNGVSVASGSIGSSALTNYNSFCIGGSAGFPTTTMDGYIDEFRLTRGVARYTTTFTPPTAAFPNG